jgi:hypothetical protein
METFPSSSSMNGWRRQARDVQYDFPLPSPPLSSIPELNNNSKP